MNITRLLLYAIMIATCLVGGCVQFLWWDYQNHMPRPCEREGRTRHYTNVEQLAQQGSNYGAVCGGFDGDRHVLFNAR
jgi:hypothetical protein